MGQDFLMMQGATVIHGGTVVTAHEQFRADVVVRDDHIAAFMADASDVPAMERIDASGLLLLPGAIDAHTHFREPDPETREGFASGSLAAAAGGVTTVVEMPQAGPTTTTVDHFEAKKAAVGHSSLIDMALWGGIVGGPGRDAEAILGMADAGAAGFKSFMADSSPSFPAVDTAKLKWAMEVVATTGLPYGLHAEDNDTLAGGIARMRRMGRTDPLAHAESRLPLVETVAVNAALYLAEQTGCWVYICHCASADALRLIGDARARGVRISVETCPQYLALNTDDLVRLKGYGRCAPAIREQSEVDRIWEFVCDGTIDIISSDHAAYSFDSKQAGEDNIFDAPLGLTGVQTLLPVCWDTMVNQHNLTPSDVARVLSANPAGIFGLASRKGALRIGADADIVLFDPGREWTIRGEDMHYRYAWTPFEGKTVRGQVIRTLRRGQTIFALEQSQPAGSTRSGAAGGRFLPRD